MIRIHGNFMDWRFGRIRIPGAIALLSLMTIIGFGIVLAELAVPRGEVHAAPAAVGNEPWLEINCLETQVEEGDDFRLLVNKKYHSEWPHETMRVFWYTVPITADASDYEHLYAERQSSNGSQSKHGRMGRDFHTLEDTYPEADETFKVQFNNSVDYGTDGECIITIKDDDGVGIYDLEITSDPHQLPTPNGGEPVIGYAVGDVIEITAHFTGDVTSINPDTGDRADYAGIYIQVGENRRFAPVFAGDGTDSLVFGYTVQPDDVDADGISVEGGGPGTGLGYNPNNRDGGIWITATGSSRINRIFHGLDDDPAHPVFQIEIGEPTITPPIDVEPTPTPEPEPPVGAENAVVIENGAFHVEHGELTKEDGGQDWFSFAASAGEDYIIEAESRMKILEGGGTPYVDGHLIDPSILEIVDERGEQVMGEQDQGGFIINWARGYFHPETDGTFYIAIGSGHQDRGGFGHYTISVRQDDHADDFRTNPDVVIRPGESITARINSDVGPDDTNPNAWAWGETGQDTAVPRWGIESADDKDVFRFKITDEGTYRIEMIDGPAGVGLWAIFDGLGNGRYRSEEGPVDSIVEDFQPGTYLFAVGTSYQSVGNTGLYTVSLSEVVE